MQCKSVWFLSLTMETFWRERSQSCQCPPCCQYVVKHFLPGIIKSSASNGVKRVPGSTAQPPPASTPWQPSPWRTFWSPTSITSQRKSCSLSPKPCVGPVCVTCVFFKSSCSCSYLVLSNIHVYVCVCCVLSVFLWIFVYHGGCSLLPAGLGCSSGMDPLI